MAISLQAPDIRELKPRITVFGVGGAGGNAVNNMIESGLLGCEFVVANTDAQALTSSKAERVIQMGIGVTQGLGAGSHPEVGSAAAEEVIDEIRDQLSGAHMAFITAGMGGGTALIVRRSHGRGPARLRHAETFRQHPCAAPDSRTVSLLRWVAHGRREHPVRFRLQASPCANLSG